MTIRPRETFIVTHLGMISCTKTMQSKNDCQNSSDDDVLLVGVVGSGTGGCSNTTTHYYNYNYNYNNDNNNNNN